MENVVHHRGRRFKRSSSSKKSRDENLSSNHIQGSSLLPPPTPPSGKTRDLLETSKPFSYQRFKPLPSIGSPGHSVPEADSAVDMTPPSPLTSPVDTARDGPHPKHQQRKVIKHKDRRNDKDLSKCMNECVTVSSATGSTQLEHCQHTEVSTESGQQHEGVTCHGGHLCQEPSPDFPFSVTLGLRLPDGTRVQRRFDYRTDSLLTVVVFGMHYLRSVEHNNLAKECVELSSCTVPKIVHNDLSLTLEQAGLVHNTVLCLTVL